jgi:hypothetical protein
LGWRHLREDGICGGGSVNFAHRTRDGKGHAAVYWFDVERVTLSTLAIEFEKHFNVDLKG